MKAEGTLIAQEISRGIWRYRHRFPLRGILVATQRSARFLRLFTSLNWLAGGATAHNLKRLAYYDGDGTWFGVGDGGSDFLEMSKDFGKTWTDLAGSLGSGKTCLDVTVGPTASGAPGQVVIMTSTRDTYAGARSAWATYTFALTANALSAAPTAGSLDFEPTAALYIALYRVTTTGFRVDTSPNGTAWTARTLTRSASSGRSTGSGQVTRSVWGIIFGGVLSVGELPLEHPSPRPMLPR